MQLRKEIISFEKTKLFGKLFSDYIQDDARQKLKDFYAYEPTYEGIKRFTEENDYAFLNRDLLSDELAIQNENVTLPEAAKKNIESLRDKNTYTVVTGHQLCLATGPAYFIYKIISVINLCEELNKKKYSKKFVPVYWMASEDHDVEEINHIHLFNKKISWQTGQKGRVGGFGLQGIEDFLYEVKQTLGESDAAKEIYSVLEKACSQSTLADATRYLVNALFGEYGLVIIDGNSPSLKSLFKEEIKKELTTQFSFHAVSETNKKLQALGYETQVNPREINLFYAVKGLRERILLNEEFRIQNSELAFTKKEIDELIESDINKFSPNVVLRPLYQQKILPNAAYVGGPGELVYWLQYRSMFEEAKIPFPALIPRNFILYLDKNISQKMEKLGMKAEDFFEAKDSLLKNFALRENPLSLEPEKEKLKELFGEAKGKISAVDKTLEASVEAELQKSLKSLETLEQKAIRAIKQKNEQSLKQIETIYDRIFPSGIFQERYENFTRFQLGNLHFISDIKSQTSSFAGEQGLIVFREQN